ncbi:NADH dehydrogenase [ubiquinone] 1 alpha subcomplex assembly factor 4 [Genypterus blacodes]|uniref:NADH dehydrogenase [ubiquinone] 1 alpha subcomplex assembly factor 4 n=1 Tax=Genypterus blacodes TaxID=154954 RepID=UPI003F76BB5C
MSNMGARVARLVRNFNLENRVHRELSRQKPSAAPRHTAPGLTAPAAEPELSATENMMGSIHNKNDPLLKLLESVYVESKDPEAPKKTAVGKAAERRPLKFTLPSDPYGLLDLDDVPKGKLTIAEALKALSSHQQQPHTWTAETVAQEYELSEKDTRALLEFFMPFQVEIIPPKKEKAKQIEES